MKKHIALAVSVAVLAGSPAFAQPMGAMGGIGNLANNPTMAKIFGTSTSASAKAEFTVDDSQGEKVQMEMVMSMLDGKTRMELDMTQVKSAKMPPNAGMQMKKMGMDKMVIISLPEKKESVMIYPSLHAYVAMSTAQMQAAAPQNDNMKVDKTSLGKETIDGHDCEKSKVVMTNDKGEHHEATVWNASDLKDFPVQMQMAENGSTVMIKFRDVKLEKPDASLFDAPSDFTKYESPQALFQTEIMKRAGAGGFGR